MILYCIETFYYDYYPLACWGALLPTENPILGEWVSSDEIYGND
ncbi:protein of unknown function [Moritella yayanosii]|uniref:Uncharacterized protein n=1 Tax=Moritella yayanosii TaxID=69539 RepID=A0A330M244_9GAMM|nr:protein of unknown function [Moritella yayanosii]